MNQESIGIATKMYKHLGGDIFKLMTNAVIYPLENITVENDKSIVSLFIALPCNNTEDFIFNKNKIDIVYMHFMKNDTYTFEFIKKCEDNPFKIINNIYYHEVQDIFELNTGLLVTVHNRENSKVITVANA
jgi:hypothetical protein